MDSYWFVRAFNEVLFRFITLQYLIRLKAWSTDAGCRVIAEIFNRQFAWRRWFQRSDELVNRPRPLYPKKLPFGQVFRLLTWLGGLSA